VDTVGIQFNIAGEDLLAVFWLEQEPFLNLHLISSDTPPQSTDTWPYPWTELVNPSYQAQSIPSDSVATSSDSAGSYGVIGSTFWPFAPYAGPALTVNGWWLDDRRTIPPTPLWGGPIDPPYPIPLTGGMLTIDSITLTLRACSFIPPSPFLPQITWADMFVDHTPTHITLHKPWVGTVYTELQGHWGIDGPSLICTTGITGDACRFNDGSTSFRVDYDLVNIGNAGANYSMIAFVLRYVDFQNFLSVYLDFQFGFVVLNRQVAGVITNLATAAFTPKPSDATHMTVYDDGSGTVAVSVNFQNKLNAIVPAFVGETHKGFFFFTHGTGSTIFALNLLITSPSTFL